MILFNKVTDARRRCLSGVRLSCVLVPLLVFFAANADERSDNLPGYGAFSDQEYRVRGSVHNARSEPLEGVSIHVKGSNTSTSSNNQGQFELNVPTQPVTLVVSYVGYEAYEVQFTGQDFLAITLAEENQNLDEVVVTALGIRKESKALAYAVSKLDGDDFEKNKNVNFANSLSGKVAGVNVVSTANGPGSSSRVTIRGNTSISGDNQPLYIINGMPMDNSQFGSTNTVSPDWGDNLSSINPDDIEEISVLKGATAAALYGSRAKNGAIIIVTKSGKGQQGVGITVNSNTTFEIPFFLWEIQNEYGQGYGGFRPASMQDAANHGQNHWGEKYDGKMTVQLDGVERPYSFVKDRVLEDFYQVGSTINNNVSFNKGNENGSFRISYTNLRNDAIVDNSRLQRNNLSLGLQQNLTKKVSIGANIDYVKEKANNRLITSGGRASMTSTILWVNSNMPTEALSPGYDENFQEKTLGTDLNATNPYFVLNRMRNGSDKDRYLTTANIRWEIWDWLYVQGRVGQDYYGVTNTNVIPDGTGFLKNGEIQQRSISFWERNFEGIIGIDKRWNTFSLTVNAGGNLMSQKRGTTDVDAFGFVVPQLHVINNTSNRQTTTDLYRKKINSLFATAEFGYKDFLYLNLTGRNDWFSTLNPKSNNYFYPSAGVSFVFSEALEMPSLINFGKLRVAYASVGGDTDPYLLNLTYGLQSYSYDGKSLGKINQLNVPNENLRPLSVNEFEAGLDVKMFNSRLGLDVAWYHKLTTNDIAVETISSTSGYQGMSVNVGEIENKGWELLLTGKPLSEGSLKWDVAANFAYNKSKVLKISNASKELVLGTVTRGWIKHIEGMEYSQIVGRTILRNEAGKDVIDATGLPIVPVDVVPFGSGIHKYTVGLTNSFAYRSFSLSFLIDSKFDAKIYSGLNYDLDHRGMSWGSLLGRADGVTLDGVTEDGQVNTVHVSADRVNNRAIVVRRRDALDDYVYDASFIKLRNFALTYHLPQRLTDKIGYLKGASLSFIGNNALILMKRTPGMDPETNFSAGNAQGYANSALPPTRSFGFNLSVKF
jgi:TonB-linked outer membrane protein, SusC/RagA family